jgi:autotransporter-associated beta strand protein
MNQICIRCQSVGNCARAFLSLAAAAITFAATPMAVGQSARPNIVVIMTDDAANEGYGFNAALYGHPTHYETPNIDALAARSVVARQGYAAAPLCSPSRAGLLTGQYQQRYGYYYNTDLMEPAIAQHQGLRPEQTTIAQHLKGLGYSTGAIGKWHVGYEDGVNLPPDKGFDEFFGFWGGARHYFYEWVPEKQMRRGDDLHELQYFAGGTNDPNNPSANDPVRGRYATDAFGDEAVDFINRRSAESNPYFLYFAPNATHSPVEAKQSDLNHFAHVADDSIKRLAANAYALDRAVGRIVAAAEASGEPTIFVFTNDNGGETASMNAPLRGQKGSMWEGGIRVPYFIHMPGVAPGIYDKPISSYDILPTVYAAAGGNVSNLDSDGVDLKPYLSGANTQNPHDVLVWKTHGYWALRKGDWKIGSLNGGPPTLYNLATDLEETTNLYAQNPAVVQDLQREITNWESKMDKQRWGPGAGNPFDHFVYYGSSNGFNVPNVWTNELTGEPATLRRSDGYPNLILEFKSKDTGQYGAQNLMTRDTGLPMMANEVRFTGNFRGPAAYAGGFSGNPLLMVNNLSGAGPKIRLEGTSSGTSARFQFQIHSELQLLDNLEFTGDGTQDFIITGAIRDLYEPRSITKTGTSVLTLKGNNAFGGDLIVNAGQVKLTGATAAINGANAIRIGSAGSFSMDSGLVSVNGIERASGGALQFTGGELRVNTVLGSLTNQGGNFSPGDSAGLTTITGNYSQTAGKMTIELGGTTSGFFDQLDINGSASLGGTLQVNLLPGFVPTDGHSFEFLTADAGVFGTFTSTILPSVPAPLTWQLQYGLTSVRLLLLDEPTIPNPAGDYNHNGVVDAADYIVWRKAFGQTGGTVGDGNSDGRVDQADYLIWAGNLGRRAPSPAHGAAASVPEPSAAALTALAAIAVWTTRRRLLPAYRSLMA